MTMDPNIGTLLGEISRRRSDEQSAATEAVPLRRVLGMQVGGELYGAGIEYITEIIKLPPITFVPGAPTYILGVTGVRGQIVPVVNLRGMLNLSDTPDGSRRPPGTTPLGAQAKPRVVVIHYEERIAGLLVDAVTEVYDLRVPLEAPLGATSRGLQIKEGQVPLGDRMLILLHIPTLFTQMES